MALKTKSKTTSKTTGSSTEKVNNTYAQMTSGKTDINPAYSLQEQEGFFNNLRNDLSYLFGDTSKYTDYDYGINYDANNIRNAMDVATQAAYDASRAEGMQNLRNASNAAMAARNQTIADMRNNMMTSAMNGANAGQVNANILSAFLNNQQANAETQTAALQNLQNIAEQRRAAMAENASNAIDKANQAAISRGELLNAEQANRVAALAGTLGQALYGTGQGLAGATSQHSETYDNVLTGSTTDKSNKSTTTTTVKKNKSSSSSKKSSGGSKSSSSTGSTSSSNRQPMGPNKTISQAEVNKAFGKTKKTSTKKTSTKKTVPSHGMMQ